MVETANLPKVAKHRTLIRKMLVAHSFTQEAALRAEIGVISMQLKYLQHILRGESNRMLARVIEEIGMEKKK